MDVKNVVLFKLYFNFCIINVIIIFLYWVMFCIVRVMMGVNFLKVYFLCFFVNGIGKLMFLKIICFLSSIKWN